MRTDSSPLRRAVPAFRLLPFAAPFAWSARRLPLLLATCVAAAMLSQGAWAAANVLTVTNTSGGTDSTPDCTSGTGTTCSLADAVVAANAQNLNDQIVFSTSVTGTIALSAALPAITSSMTIQGPGANKLTISGSALTGASSGSIFTVNSGATVSISGLTLSGDADSLAGQGGAITNAGTLTVSGCALANNSATDGGAIYSLGALTVSDSTFSGNSAGTLGGAIYVTAATLTVVNSTFSGNSSAQSGGAIVDSNGTTATITNSTFAKNSSATGGAIATNSAASGFSVNNDIFVGNMASTSGAGIEDSTSAVQGKNSVYFGNLTKGNEDDCNGCGASSQPASGGNVLAGVNPLAMPLGNYGGPTETILPQFGSAAMCAGSSTLAVDASGHPLTMDERGWAFAGSCTDAGAVQTNYLMVTNTSGGTDATPNCTSGTGSSCSLADAIGVANAATTSNGTGGDIAFAASLTKTSAATINLTAGLTISGAANISGPGANLLTVNGSSSTVFSDFTVNSGAVATVDGLTVAKGNATGTGQASNGGGFNNSGTLAILSCAVSNNTAGNDGGGVDNSAGSLTIVDSTVSDNTAASLGGGIENEGNGTSTILESTVSGNATLAATGASGGGIDIANGSVNLTNSTVSNNVQRGTLPLGGGGGIGAVGTLTLTNSIVAGNTDASGLANDIAGTFTDGGGANDNKVNESAATIALAPLGNYGGPVSTMLPLPGSPAICGGSFAHAASGTDERGDPLQPGGGYCSSTTVDAGAVQTNYTSIQFTNANPTWGYAGLVNAAVATPAAPNVAVMESGNSVNNIPVTLGFTGSGAATGLTATTANGTGATFSGLIVNAADTGDTLTASLPALGTVTLPASAVGLAIEQGMTLTSSLPGATVGTAYSGPLVASGGTGAFSDTLTSGSLPGGLTFDTTTGSLTGTPTTSSSNDNFGITITDHYGFTASGTYNLSVAKGTAQFSFSNTTEIYNGKAQPVTVTTTPLGLTVNVTYTGISPTVYATSSTPPKNVGSYTVNASIGGTDANNWTGSSSTTLNISSGNLVITLGNLNQTYGSTTPVTVSTNPANVTIDLSFKGTGTTTYGPSPTQPTNAGTYQVTASVDPTETNYTGTPAQIGTLTIAQEPVTLTLSNNLSQTFGSTTPVTVTTSVKNVTVDLTFTGINGTTYAQSSTQPTNAGTYSVNANVDQTTEPNYSGTTSGTLTIAKEPVTITLGNLNQTFNSTGAVTVTVSPSVTVDVTYTGVNGTVYAQSSTPPTNAGTYQVNAALDPTVTANYTGGTSQPLTIAKEAVTITLGNLKQTFGSLSAITVTASPVVTVDVTYTGVNGTVYPQSSTPPTNAGTYQVNAALDPTVTANYSGGTSGVYTIAPEPVTIALSSNLAQTFGATTPVTATGTPGGVTIDLSFSGVGYGPTPTQPTNAGTYSVTASVDPAETNFTGSVSQPFVIKQATATVTIAPASLTQVYTGSPLAVAVTTTPTVKAVSVTYNASTTVPINPGTYSVIATVQDPNYVGTASGTLTIENFSLALPTGFTGAMSITQGYASQTYTSASGAMVPADPFTPQAISVTPTASIGYAPNLTLQCTVSATTAPTGSTGPACLLNNGGSTVAGDNIAPTTVTLDATKASPGIYTVAIAGSDPSSGLVRTASFTVTIRSASSAVTLQSGATKGNSATVNFVLPANVSLSSLSCTSIAGPTLAAPVTPIALGVGCTESPTSISSSTSVQEAPVTVTVNTGEPITTARLANLLGGKPGYLAAGVLGIPLLGLLGLLGGRRKPAAAMFRLFLILGIAMGAMQITGCGGSFTRTTTASGSTPPGAYSILVQGTGSDKQPYQAVVQLNVTR